jgi:hypothetical protein
MKPFYLIFLVCLGLQGYGQQTPYEKSRKLATATYPEVIEYCKALDAAFPQARLITYGPTDFIRTF